MLREILIPVVLNFPSLLSFLLSISLPLIHFILNNLSSVEPRNEVLLTDPGQSQLILLHTE